MRVAAPKFLKPTFFPSAGKFRDWLQKHHATASEVQVGFHKVGSGKPSMTWSESVDQALCFGWIDGIRRAFGPTSYVIRFTPRRPRSSWSLINIAKVRKLRASGQMRAAGEKAFALRDALRTNRYSFERARATLAPGLKKLFRANRKAWEFFTHQPPGYRKVMTWWVVSAKLEATRRSRLARLITASRSERRL